MSGLNIVKFGGSIVNPDGRYNNKVIDEFIDLVGASADNFIFVIGGGKICRHFQSASRPYLEDALKNVESINRANDIIGIAATHINAFYVLEKFKEKFGDRIYPEVIIDPTVKTKGDYKVYFAGGWKPGCSTDKDMMLLAKSFHADRVFKISDFEIMKRISPLELAKYSSDKESMKKVLSESEDIKEMTWKDLKTLVGDSWVPGLNTPFDPEAAKIGYSLRKKLTMYVGRQEEFSKMLVGEEFRGTIVRN